MAHASFLKTHRTWEDWAGIGLGILIGLSPWIAGQVADPVVLRCTLLLGLLVLILAQFELVWLHRWQEVAVLACGVALLTMPVILGYSATRGLREWHYALGMLVTLLAALELWQDWELSDEELSKHGQ